MDRSIPPERSVPPAGSSADDGIPPYLVSREYEDYLDWLENQRRTRAKRNRGGRLFTLFSSALVSAVAFAGAMMRRR
jgi:hypothetical protein